jgi:hypothetical protein
MIERSTSSGTCRYTAGIASASTIFSQKCERVCVSFIKLLAVFSSAESSLVIRQHRNSICRGLWLCPSRLTPDCCRWQDWRASRPWFCQRIEVRLIGQCSRRIYQNSFQTRSCNRIVMIWEWNNFTGCRPYEWQSYRCQVITLIQCAKSTTTRLMCCGKTCFWYVVCTISTCYSGWADWGSSFSDAALL